jgi:hypothetical protein
MLLTGGCTTVYPRIAAGTGTYSYVSGALTWTYPVTVEELKVATLAALTELHLPIQTQMLDGLGGVIEATRGEHVTVRLLLRPETEKTTSLSVRVGTWGNRQESEHIHTAVRKQLGL